MSKSRGLRPYTPRVRRPVAERFWEKVDKESSANGCWWWTGATLAKGYGVLGRGNGEKGNVLAHRVSWELHNGPAPPEMVVCHNCPGGNNPRCVNPAHLWLGTHAASVTTEVRRRTAARGERAAKARLTNDQVQVLRQRFPRCPPFSVLRVEAAALGVNAFTLYGILRGRGYHDTVPSHTGASTNSS